MLTNLFFLLPLKKAITPNSITWFSEDFYGLLIRLGINLLFLTILIRVLYYTKTRRKDYLFTYYLIGTITFFLCFGLMQMDIDTGMGLGLFAIFGIIRYRTDAIEIKEMTYLFMVIGISVVNALASNELSISEVGVINITVVLLTYFLENIWLMKHETRKTINYERIDLAFVEHPQGGTKRAKPAGEMTEGLWMPGSLRHLEELILEGRIRLKRNPVLISAMMSAVTETDRWDNKWLSKQRAINKIDAAVALCMAVGAAMAGDTSGTIDDWLKSLA